MKWIIFIIFILNIFLIEARLYGEGIYGSCLYGYDCAEEIQIVQVQAEGLPPIVEGGGGQILNVEAQPALAEALRKNQTPSCTEGNQYFEGACYPCPINGVLYRKPDRTIACVICDVGAEYDGNGGCKKIVTPINKTGFDVMELGSKISPQNPHVGFGLLSIASIGLLYWLYTRFTYAHKYEKVKKKREEEGAEEQKEEVNEEENQ